MQRVQGFILRAIIMFASWQSLTKSLHKIKINAIYRNKDFPTIERYCKIKSEKYEIILKI